VVSSSAHSLIDEHAVAPISDNKKKKSKAAWCHKIERIFVWMKQKATKCIRSRWLLQATQVCRTDV